MAGRLAHALVRDCGSRSSPCQRAPRSSKAGGMEVGGSRSRFAARSGSEAAALRMASNSWSSWGERQPGLIRLSVGLWSRLLARTMRHGHRFAWWWLVVTGRLGVDTSRGKSRVSERRFPSVVKVRMPW